LSGFADRGAPRGVPLTVYRLIARDTAEQRIAELRSTRASLADALVAANPSLLRGLTRDDVRFLLG
jgi:SNF2 family DNA or RNA helicase